MVRNILLSNAPARRCPILCLNDELKADLNASPLCIEEFDLSDRNFRPCPCGYQVR